MCKSFCVCRSLYSKILKLMQVQVCARLFSKMCEFSSCPKQVLKLMSVQLRARVYSKTYEFSSCPKDVLKLCCVCVYKCLCVKAPVCKSVCTSAGV